MLICFKNGELSSIPAGLVLWYCIQILCTIHCRPAKSHPSITSAVLSSSFWLCAAHYFSCSLFLLCTGPLFQLFSLLALYRPITSAVLSSCPVPAHYFSCSLFLPCTGPLLQLFSLLALYWPITSAVLSSSSVMCASTLYFKDSLH